MVSKKKLFTCSLYTVVWSKKSSIAAALVNDIELMVTNISILFIFISSCLYSSLIMSACQMATKTLEITR